MTNIKALVRGIITAHQPLTAIIPAVRMFADWPVNFQTLPVLSYIEENDSTDSEDYFDSQALTSTVVVKIDLFGPPSKDLFTAVDALNDAMTAAGWNRDSCIPITEPDTLNQHYVLNYSTKVYN